MKVVVRYVNDNCKRNHQEAYPTIFKGEVSIVYFRECQAGWVSNEGDIFSIILDHPAKYELDKQGSLWLEPRYYSAPVNRSNGMGD